MAEIPRSVLDALTESLNALSSAARAAAVAEISAIEWESVAELRDKAAEILDGYAEYVCDMAAQLSADSFDAVRSIAVGEPLGAEPYHGYSRDATEGAVRALVQGVADGGTLEAFAAKCAARIDFEAKRAAAATTAHNCGRDPLQPRWARVPTGAETCSFCLMLASRDFVYASEQSAGGGAHWHESCDCRAVQGYPGMKVEGYDSAACLEKWYESDHYEYMQRRAERLCDANYIEFMKRLDAKSGLSESEAIVNTWGLAEEFKEKWGVGYRAVLRKDRESPYRTSVDGVRLKTFDDVRAWLNDSHSKAELEKRRALLEGAYGEESSQMASAAMRNALRHAEKQFEITKREYGAVVSQINTNYHYRYAGKDSGIIFVGDFGYRFEIADFGEYVFIEKRKIQ